MDKWINDSNVIENEREELEILYFKIPTLHVKWYSVISKWNQINLKGTLETIVTSKKFEKYKWYDKRRDIMESYKVLY